MSASQPLIAGQVYLSREGKVFGPYTQEDLARFRTEGELAQYAWLWDGLSGKWMPIHSEPPKPKVDRREQTASHGAPFAHASARIIHAVCYDAHHLVGGMVESIDDKGAIVKCPSEFQELGPFRKGQKLVVNLVDESSGKSENVDAYVVECTRQDRGFLYRFLWYVAPEMLDRRRKRA